MSEIPDFKLQIRNSPGVRLAVLFGAFFILLLVTSAIALFIESLPLPSQRSKQLFISTIQCILAFCVPAYILARFSSNNPAEWLYLKKWPGIKGIIGVIIIYIISFPMMEWLIQWNSNLHLPDAFSSIETTLRKWEDANNAAASNMLNASGWIQIVVGVLVVGVLTGFSEEIFFRGGFQGVLLRSSINKSMSVWLTAILFSTMHFQFFGFVPRLVMGAFFGYLLLWSKSLWLPIFAHALNNSMVVIVAGLTGKENFNSTEIADFNSSLFLPCISLATTVLFLLFFRNIFFSGVNNKSLKWQKNHLPPVSGK